MAGCSMCREGPACLFVSWGLLLSSTLTPTKKTQDGLLHPELGGVLCPEPDGGWFLGPTLLLAPVGDEPDLTATGPEVQKPHRAQDRPGRARTTASKAPPPQSGLHFLLHFPSFFSFIPSFLHSFAFSSSNKPVNALRGHFHFPTAPVKTDASVGTGFSVLPRLLAGRGSNEDLQPATKIKSALCRRCRCSQMNGSAASNPLLTPHCLH